MRNGKRRVTVNLIERECINNHRLVECIAAKIKERGIENVL